MHLKSVNLSVANVQRDGNVVSNKIQYHYPGRSGIFSNSSFAGLWNRNLLGDSFSKRPPEAELGDGIRFKIVDAKTSPDQKKVILRIITQDNPNIPERLRQPKLVVEADRPIFEECQNRFRDGRLVRKSCEPVFQAGPGNF